jgi:putative phosphoesterase
MKLAVLSDIHGNADALAAVMSDLAAQSPDQIINLGDCFSGPLDVVRTADLLADLNALTVRGNHDRALIGAGAHDIWDAAAAPFMPRAALDWMATLPPNLRIGEVFACHATPQDDTTFWTEAMIGGKPERNSLARIEALAGDTSAEVLLCGHTHVARSLRLGDGRLVINPGSVGCPGFVDHDLSPTYIMSVGLPHASYAILERSARGWTISQRQVPYDTKPAIARAADYPDWVAALSTGWAA